MLLSYPEATDPGWERVKSVACHPEATDRDGRGLRCCLPPGSYGSGMGEVKSVLATRKLRSGMGEQLRIQF